MCNRTQPRTQGFSQFKREKPWERGCKRTYLVADTNFQGYSDKRDSCILTFIGKELDRNLYWADARAFPEGRVNTGLTVSSQVTCTGTCIDRAPCIKRTLKHSPRANTGLTVSSQTTCIGTCIDRAPCIKRTLKHSPRANTGLTVSSQTTCIGTCIEWWVDTLYWR